MTEHEITALGPAFAAHLRRFQSHFKQDRRAKHFDTYSPELNPMENLWHYLRSHYWSNRSYEDWEALKEAACAAMVAVGTDAERIKSVCAAPYLECGEGAGTN